MINVLESTYGEVTVRVSFETISIRNNRNWNRNQFRHYPKQNVCFGCFASIPKQRVSIEPKHTEDQPKQFDREHILLFFTENLGFFRFFLFFLFFCFFLVFFRCFLVCFKTVCFGCFASIPKQVVSMFRLNRNKQKTQPNSLKESIFENFSENLRLFPFVSVCYETNLFVSVVSIQVRNTETNQNFFFLVSRNKLKQTQNRSCFGLFQFEPKFIFVCFEDTLVTVNSGKGSHTLCFSLNTVSDCFYQPKINPLLDDVGI